MRITVSHNKPKQEVIKAVDRSFDELFRGMAPLQFVNQHRRWHGSTLRFSCDAKMGFLSTPIKGTVEVTEKDLTIDADLGVLEKLVGNQARTSLERGVRGLLN